MKLLYVLPEYLPDSGGGIITHYARVLPELARRGHSVKVLVASKEKLDRSACEIEGVMIESLQSRFYEEYADRFGRWEGLDIFRFMLPVAWAAWAQARESPGHDLVETTDWGLLFPPWIVSERKSPVVVSLHGSCGQVDWHEKPFSRSLDGDLVRMAEGSALRCADAVHANSRANAEFWRTQAGCDVTVIPPAFESRRGQPLTSGKSGSKGLVVGRLQNLKGAGLLCQALRLTPEVEIEWIGSDTAWEGSGVMASAHLAASHPDVFGKKLRWVGPLDREGVMRKMKEAAFLVVPSLWDVFNLTVAEGMEAGLPVICSRAAGAEMLIEDGRSGFLFDPSSPEQLAARLRQASALTGEQRSMMGHAARESALSKLATDRVVEMMEQSYGQAIAKGSRASVDEWSRSLFYPGDRPLSPPKTCFLRRVARKAGRMLAEV